MPNTPKDVFQRKQATEAKYLIDQWVPSQISMYHSQNIAEKVVQNTNRVFKTEGLVAVPLETLDDIQDNIKEISKRPGADLYTLELLTRTLKLISEAKKNSVV